MNNKPVAWMYKCLLSDNVEVSLEKPPAEYKNTIPLYTHLADLTDEEIKEIELLKTEIFVKDAIIKCYKETLEQISTGGIDGESKNYKDTVYVMRSIASDALSILRKAQEK